MLTCCPAAAREDGVGRAALRLRCTVMPTRAPLNLCRRQASGFTSLAESQQHFDCDTPVLVIVAHVPKGLAREAVFILWGVGFGAAWRGAARPKLNAPARKPTLPPTCSHTTRQLCCLTPSKSPGNRSSRVTRRPAPRSDLVRPRASNFRGPRRRRLHGAPRADAGGTPRDPVAVPEPGG